MAKLKGILKIEGTLQDMTSRKFTSIDLFPPL